MTSCIRKQLLSYSQRCGLLSFPRSFTPTLPRLNSRVLSLASLCSHIRPSPRFRIPLRSFSSSPSPSMTPSPVSPLPSPSHPPPSARAGEVKVMAYYLSPPDVQHLQSQSNQLKFSRPPCTLVLLSPSSPSTPFLSPAPAPAASQFDVFASYVLVFDYGAVCFFNTSEAAQLALLDSLPNRHLHLPAPRLKDDYTVQVDPALPASGAQGGELTCHFGPDSLTLSSLDCYAVRIIAQVLAQTVGMEQYEQTTSAMLTEFHSLSLQMQATGALPHSSSQALVQLLAQNNTILTTVLTQLKVLDRSEIAWRLGRYDGLWVGMREEFDLEGRYETLETKLRLLHDNHPLFLEVLHHQSSTRMEVIIIALIAVEVLLAVVFHSPILTYVMEEMGVDVKGLKDRKVSYD